MKNKNCYIVYRLPNGDTTFGEMRVESAVRWRDVKRFQNKKTVSVKENGKRYFDSVKKTDIIGKAQTMDKLVQKFSHYLI